jgi:hypothetical protein
MGLLGNIIQRYGAFRGVFEASINKGKSDKIVLTSGS